MCSSTFFFFFLVLFGERDFLINLEQIEYFSRRFGAKFFFFFVLPCNGIPFPPPIFIILLLVCPSEAFIVEDTGRV